MRIALDLKPCIVAEVDKVLGATDIGTRPEVFRCAFRLLRTHLNAATRNCEIYTLDPKNPNERHVILPNFIVND